MLPPSDDSLRAKNCASVGKGLYTKAADVRTKSSSLCFSQFLASFP